jgi:signal transduction histidine kinase
LGEVFSDLPKRFATPLTSILARTQQLIDNSNDRDEQTTKHLAIIKMQTERMMKDVRTLQDVRSESLLAK